MGKTQVEPIGELEKRQDINFQTRLSEDIDSGIYRKDELEQESEILIRVEEEIEKYLKIIEGKFAEIAGNQFHDSLIDYNVEVIKHK